MLLLFLNLNSEKKKNLKSYMLVEIVAHNLLFKATLNEWMRKIMYPYYICKVIPRNWYVLECLNHFMYLLKLPFLGTKTCMSCIVLSVNL